MRRTKVSFYEILTYVTYGFYFLLGLVWLILSYMTGKGFSLPAFMLMSVFAIQAYYHHKLTNLILGILVLFMSIFMLLDVINAANLMDKHAVYTSLTKSLLTVSIVSVVMSVILVFSYTKLSFKDEY